MDLSRTVSKIDGDFSRKSPDFQSPCILHPRWRIGFRHWGVRKLEWWAEKEVWQYLQSSGYSRTDTRREQRQRLRKASCGKNGSECPSYHPHVHKFIHYQMLSPCFETCHNVVLRNFLAVVWCIWGANRFTSPHWGWIKTSKGGIL